MSSNHARILYPAFGARKARAVTGAAFEDCDQQPRPITVRRARGILHIHTAIGCSHDNCVRLRAAQEYLAIRSDNPPMPGLITQSNGGRP